MRGRFLAQKLAAGAEARASIASWLIRHWRHSGRKVGDQRTDVGLLERRRVVDTVPGDGDDGALSLTTFDNDEFLLRRRAREHDLGVLSEHLVNLRWRHVT